MAELVRKASEDDGDKRLNKRTGVNQSLYISLTAASLLKTCRKSTKRSKSAVVSLLLEKYGPSIARDPKLLNI